MGLLIRDQNELVTNEARTAWSAVAKMGVVKGGANLLPLVGGMLQA